MTNKARAEFENMLTMTIEQEVRFYERQCIRNYSHDLAALIWRFEVPLEAGTGGIYHHFFKRRGTHNGGFSYVYLYSSTMVKNIVLKRSPIRP